MTLDVRLKKKSDEKENQVKVQRPPTGCYSPLLSEIKQFVIYIQYKARPCIRCARGKEKKHPDVKNQRQLDAAVMVCARHGRAQEVPDSVDVRPVDEMLRYSKWEALVVDGKGVWLMPIMSRSSESDNHEMNVMEA